MLPAIEIDGRIVTESDDILVALEREFGPLHKGMATKAVVQLRQLERHLFRAWCRCVCMSYIDWRWRRVGVVAKSLCHGGGGGGGGVCGGGLQLARARRGWPLLHVDDGMMTAVSLTKVVGGGARGGVQVAS